MSRVNLVILWHMHQPQYKDPETGKYLLPWTRLHALKDYWGMVKILEEFPGVHMTFNFVPLLAEQIEEYASGKFKETWFDIAFAKTETLNVEQKREIIERAFQVNDMYVYRWPRFAELRSQVQSAGAEASLAHFSVRDWRDLQVLSQLAWTDEEYFVEDAAIAKLSEKGKNYTAADSATLQERQQRLLAAVLPEYRKAEARGQIEISTTPYYHPILPLLCDTDIARVSNPHTPLPQPPFRYPEDAREQLLRARKFHERVFGKPPAGLWPSEGSVSDQTLEIGMELGFKWFATDEGVLGRTRNVGFWRDPSGYPENGPELYTPWRFKRGKSGMSGFFRDHYLSDLVGFVYSRMSADVAAEDLHRRIRAIGDREPPGRTATVSIILDGENAWEYYPGNGREFLRKFYKRIQEDSQISPLTVSESAQAAPDQPVLDAIFPGSWIGANFDVWIGHAEDVRSWELLRQARRAFGKALDRPGFSTPEGAVRLARARESLMAAEGSDWNWWYGPEHGSVNDAEFDSLYRKHLTGIYNALGEQAPDELAHPIKKVHEGAKHESPSAYLDVAIDGRESSYFEWLGAGYYATERRTSAMHGRVYVFGDFYYGFAPDLFFLRIDPVQETIAEIPDFQLRITIWDSRETRLTLRVENRKLTGCIVEQGGLCLLRPEKVVSSAYDKVLELGLSKELFDLEGRRELLLSVAIWRGGLPLDILPAEGMLNITLGDEAFAW